MTREFYGNLVNGQRFVLEVPQKDAKGWHSGYGPGTQVYTKGHSGCPVLLGYNRVYLIK